MVKQQTSGARCINNRTTDFSESVVVLYS